MKKVCTFIAALLMVSVLTSCAETHTRESTGQYIDSAAITTKTEFALMKAKDVPSHDIHVTTFKDRVQLSGFVDNKAQVKRAGEIAKSIKGVRVVKNDLLVR